MSSKKNRIVSTTKAGPSLERARVVGQDLAQNKTDAALTALARSTDALVTRVVESAHLQSRDPGDHTLDLSKSYYQEESAEGQHSVQCDRCTLKSPGARSRRQAIAVAEATGWVVTDDYDHCPVCKDGSKLLKPGGAALVVPPKLSHAQAILVTRLRYLGDAIERGASLPALLQNSVRSQHRSMLSDLAMGFSYEIDPLLEAVLGLTQKNADIHPVFMGEAARFSWVFVRELFAALRAEDEA